MRRCRASVTTIIEATVVSNERKQGTIGKKKEYSNNLILDKILQIIHASAKISTK